MVLELIAIDGSGSLPLIRIAVRQFRSNRDTFGDR